MPRPGIDVAAYWMIALGAGIGLMAGIIGAGPSILTVLLLEHAGGLGIGSAITTSLAVVAVMSLVALVPYARAGEVLWRAAVDFGIASMAGALLSGHLAARIPAKALLFIFLGAMVIAAVTMLWQRPPPEQGEPRPRAQTLAVLGVGGLLVGSLTGLVGLGGGFAVVPLLVVFARAPVRAAVGTSILVIAMNTLAGLAGHLPHVSIDWRVVAYLGVAEAAGSLIGVRVAKRVSGRTLCRAFGGIMLVGAAGMLVNAALR
jgi:uncharacterized membrane protein YfcA